MASKRPPNDDIEGEIDPQFFIGHFGGTMQFKQGIIEAIKNPLDADATLVWIDTRERGILVVRDNGVGLTEGSTPDSQRRSAFTKLGKSTSRGRPNKSGKFGSGKAHFAFPLASTMRVLTAPADEQDAVYSIEIDMDTYFQRLSVRDTFTWKREPKSSATWPIEHETGTVITYKVREAKLSNVPRGKTLSKMLVACLPPYLAKKVRVDGEKLSERDMHGEFAEVVPVRAIGGAVQFNLFRPKERGTDDKLRLGANLVGEVPFIKFYEMLPLELREKIPEVFQHLEVCGEILSPWFSQFSVDSRTGFNEELLTHDGLTHFIAALIKVAPQVEENLGLECSKNSAAGNEDEAVGHRIADILDDTWGSVPGEGPGTQPEDEDAPSDPTRMMPLHLNLAFSHGFGTRELEVGETLDLTPVMRSDIAADNNVQQIEWDTEECLGTVNKRKDGSMRLTAKTVGDGRITATLGPAISATCHYKVVRKREIRLNVGCLVLKEGQSKRLRVLNNDRLDRRRLTWEKVSGPGVLEVSDDKLSATFTGSARGVAQVRLSSSTGESWTCDITIKAANDNARLVKIGEHMFALKTKRTGTPEVVRVINSVVADRPGEIVINASSPVYTQLLERGESAMLDATLVSAISQMYQQGVFVQRMANDGKDISPFELDALTRDHVINPSVGVLNSMFQTMLASPKDKAKKGKGRKAK